MTREELSGASQKAISLRVDLNNRQLLETLMVRTRDKARLASLGLPHSGDWLNVVPSPALGLHIKPQEFRYTVLYRLGAPLYTAARQCTACPQASDQHGDHAISCGYKGERIAHHNHLCDALHHTAASAALAPVREERALLPGTDARPADVLLPHWTGGRDTALDVTVVNPLQIAMVDQAAVNPGYALQQAFNRKCRQTREACEREGMVFIPLPVETLGGWHEAAIVQIKKMRKALANTNGQEENEAVRHLFQRLAVLLVKGNAALFINRIPTFPGPEVNGMD